MASSSTQLDECVFTSLRNTDFINAQENFDRLLQILTQPPMFTTLRINFNKISAKEAQHEIKATLQEQMNKTGVSPFQTFWHADFGDCLLVQNRGPINVGKLEKEVIVDLACGMAVLRGAHVFIQGIMAAPQGLSKGEKVSVFADLDRKCLKGMTSKYSGNKVFIGNGISQVSRADVFNANSGSLRGVGILMIQPLWEAPCLADLNYPWLVPQNLPSIACVHALDPQPGETVLDMCAAPGGKTSHIAALMTYKGNIVALEKSKERAKKLNELGLQNIQVYAFDSTKALSEEKEREDGPPFAACSFDRILVDAPCSALGQRPCFVNRISLNQLRSFPVIQQKLLLVAAELLKPGGVLVYSTCTITLAENEEQVAKFLAKRPDMELVTPKVQMGTHGLVGSQLSDTQRSMVQRFDPSMLLAEPMSGDENLHNIDTIGFFIAKFVKSKQSNS